MSIFYNNPVLMRKNCRGEKRRLSFRFFTFISLLLVTGACAAGNTHHYLRPAADISGIKMIAVLPVETLTQDQYAGERIRRIVITELLSRGVDVIEPGEITSDLIALQKPLYSLEKKDLRELGGKLGADAVLLGSVEAYSVTSGLTVSYPEVSINLRLVETSTGNIIWSVSRYLRRGEFLDEALRRRGYVAQRDGKKSDKGRSRYLTIVEQKMTYERDLHMKLLQGTFLALALLLLSINCGCKTTETPFHIAGDVDLSYIKKVAVLPLDNLTADRYAASAVRQVVINELLMAGLVDVGLPGDATVAMEKAGVREASSLNAQKIKEIASALKVQAVILGAVEKYGELRSGSFTAPEVTITLMLADAETGYSLGSNKNRCR
jgi:TolB-like protein